MAHRETPLVGSGQGDAIRASDADRDAVGELLREHHADGRLTDEEFESRFAQSVSARTLGELRALVSDLPAERPTPSGEVGRWWERPFRPGILPALVALAIVVGAFWRQATWYDGVPHRPLPWPLVVLAIVGAMVLRGRWRAHRRRWLRA
jgi:hypothetical protein